MIGGQKFLTFFFLTKKKKKLIIIEPERKIKI